MGRKSRGPSGAADGKAPFRMHTLAPALRAAAPVGVRRPGALTRAVRAVSLAVALALVPAALPPVAAGDVDTPALAAVPARFEATSDGATVQLRWSLAPGTPVVGFQLLRALQRDGPYAPVNPWLIPTAPSGAYAFADLAVDPGRTYHYRLEAVDAAGHKTLRGPLTIAVMPEEATSMGAPDGGGFPAVVSARTSGANAGGGCAAVGAGAWRDAAGLVLLLGAALVRLRRRARRFPPGPSMG